MSCSFIIFKLFSLLFSLSYFLVLEIDRLLRDFKGLGIRGGGIRGRWNIGVCRCA